MIDCTWGARNRKESKYMFYSGTGWYSGSTIYKDRDTGNMTNHGPWANAQSRSISHVLTKCKVLGLQLLSMKLSKIYML